MTKLISAKQVACLSLATIAMLASSSAVLAHTRLQIPTIAENTRVYNNEIISHGCKDPVSGTTKIPVMGTSLVFPDATATVTSKPAGSAATVAATPAGAVTDWLQGAGEGYLKKVYDSSLFGFEGQKTNNYGNVVSYWTGGVHTLPGINYVGAIPFKTDAVLFQTASCAASVTFVVPIVDICKITNMAGLVNENVNMWTPAVGSNFDGVSGVSDGYNSPATLKITRDMVKNPLPAACGAGLDITITPTAAQINRDMPIIDGNGTQIWPATN